MLPPIQQQVSRRCCCSCVSSSLSRTLFLATGSKRRLMLMSSSSSNGFSSPLSTSTSSIASNSSSNSTSTAIRRRILQRDVDNDSTRNPSFNITKLSYDGTIETVDLHTNELLKSTSIFARDLFTLNLTSRQESSETNKRRGSTRARTLRQRSTVSEINPRKSLHDKRYAKIVLSFGNIRAVVGLDYIFIFDAHDPSVREFANDLAQTYRSMSASSSSFAGDPAHALDEPHELVFLEAVLKDTVESFNRRLRLFEPLVDSFLDNATEELYQAFVPTIWYSSLMPLQDALQSFEIQVKKSLDCLTELLDNDDEMLALLLTEQAAGDVDYSRHEHVELLIGVYARQINNVLMEIQYLAKRIQSTQNFVGLTMNAYRNRMVRINLHIGIVALSLGFGTTMAGFFGMNLISGLEQSPTAFASVVGMSGMGGLLIGAGWWNYSSTRVMKKKATSRLEQTEIVTQALSDMHALDYTIKSLEKGSSLDKDQFRLVLEKARHSKHVTNEEVDLLFDVFDRVKDGYLRVEDFKPNELEEEEEEFRENK